MNTLAPELITDALERAVKAPSPYNTQPWRFVVDGYRIELWLDRARVLQTADPDAREARLACGAALLNLRLAVRAHGHAVTVDALPDRTRPDLLAEVRVGRVRPKTLPEDRLAKAIDRRHTNRQPFLEREIGKPLRHALLAAAREEGALIDASDRYDVLAQLVRRANRVLDSDPGYQAEFRRWTGGPPSRPDGVPIDAVGPGPDADRVLTLRSFHRPSPTPPRQFEQQPLLAAVLTYGTGARADVTAGMAMQRVLLTACDLGLSSSFVSQPFEVPAIRAALADAFRADGEPHTLLRIGYGYPVAPTPRRAVDDVATRR